jgi:hypothetical protein
MPGPILHLGATVTCSHGGQAVPVAPIAAVTVSGQPVVTMASPYGIVGCPFPPNAGGPCATGTWATPALSVMVMGQPVLVQGGTGVCVPTGVPMLATQAQTFVVAK